jgi:hypothetical protein
LVAVVDDDDDDEKEGEQDEESDVDEAEEVEAEAGVGVGVDEAKRVWMASVRDEKCTGLVRCSWKPASLLRLTSSSMP